MSVIDHKGGNITVCEPIYPVPPVKRTYFPFLASADMLQIVQIGLDCRDLKPQRGRIFPKFFVDSIP